MRKPMNTITGEPSAHKRKILSSFVGPVTRKTHPPPPNLGTFYFADRPRGRGRTQKIGTANSGHLTPKMRTALAYEYASVVYLGVLRRTQGAHVCKGSGICCCINDTLMNMHRIYICMYILYMGTLNVPRY